MQVPLLQLEGVHPNDGIRTRAVMCWPSDTETDARRHYYAADYANGFVYEHDPGALWPWPGSLIRDLLEAPSWVTIMQEQRRRTKDGIIAGYVFASMFLMDCAKDRLPPRGKQGASLDKAFWIALQIAASGATYGDGSNMASGLSKVKECWKAYRSVAHFWAALEINRSFPVCPQDQIFHSEHFDSFMRIVSALQVFGIGFQMDNRSKQATTNLLTADMAWLIDTERFKPALHLPADSSAFESSLLVRALKTYTATK